MRGPSICGNSISPNFTEFAERSGRRRAFDVGIPSSPELLV